MQWENVDLEEGQIDIPAKGGWGPKSQCECTLPIRHDGGTLEFHQRGGGTEVDWTSRFTIPIPFLGETLARVATRNAVEQFTQLLLNAKRELERGGGG